MVDFRKLINKTPEERQAEMDRHQAEYRAEEEAYYTLLIDANNSAKTNAWEASFIISLITKFNSNDLTRRVELSNKQNDKLKEIEEKIYAVG